jgi:hypothetical protein
MTRGACTSVATLVAVALLAACAGGGSDPPDAGSSGAAGTEAQSVEGARPEPEVFEGDDFYEVPDPLPGGTHGDLIRYEVVEEAGTDDLTLYRVMYLSESVPGDPIAVTGTWPCPRARPPTAAATW